MNESKRLLEPTFVESLSEYAVRCGETIAKVYPTWDASLREQAKEWAKRPYRWRDGSWRALPEIVNEAIAGANARRVNSAAP